MGCAAIVASKSLSYRVESSPPGALVRLNGSAMGQTPVVIDLDRKSQNLVEVTSPGYSPSSCRPQMSPGVGYILGDVAWCFFGFPLGCIAFIDAGGAWNTLDNDHCQVSLIPESQLGPVAPTAPPMPPRI